MLLKEVSFQVVKREKVSELISQQLIQAIIKGHFKVGDTLPSERQLAELFNASRVAVREAIRTLNAKGLATSKQGLGTIVNKREQWNTLDPQIFLLESNSSAFDQLLEVRRIIEPEMAALAAQRITLTHLERLQTILATHSDESVEQHIRDDMAFHMEIAKASQNEVLLIIMNSINELLQESRYRTYQISDAPKRAWDHHADLVRALESRDAQAARQSMHTHLDQVKNELDLLKQQSDQ